MTFCKCNECDQEVEVKFNADRDPACPECRFVGSLIELEEDE